MATFEYCGHRVAYECRGDGTDLVFMHGLGADRRQALSALSDIRGCRLICLDMPGHGETHYSTGKGDNAGYGFDLFSDIVIALLDSLSIENAIFGGISMGAGISMRIALKASDRVRALLLVRPAWLDQTSPANLEIIDFLGRWIAQQGLDHAEALMKAHPVYKAEVRTNPGCAASIAGVLVRPQALAAAGVLSALVQDAPFQDLNAFKRVGIPALVIANDGDPLHPVEVARTIAAVLPCSQFEQVPERYRDAVNHHQVLNRVINSFLLSHGFVNVSEGLAT